MIKTVYDNSQSTNEGTEHHDFGLVDNNGRAVGATIVYLVHTYVPAKDDDRSFYTNVEPGTYFVWHPQATRGGMSFGPAQDYYRCKTEAERHLAIEKYLKGARARAVKAWA